MITLKEDGRVSVKRVDGNRIWRCSIEPWDLETLKRETDDRQFAEIKAYWAENIEKPASDDAYPLEQAISDKRSAIDGLLKKKLVGTFDGHRFQIDDQSAARLNQVLAIAEAVERGGMAWPGVYWTTADNALFHVQNIDALRNMVVALGMQGAAIFEVWQRHKLTVSQIETVPDIQKYDIEDGWP